jgi:hypothetical protein
MIASRSTFAPDSNLFLLIIYLMRVNHCHDSALLRVIRKNLPTIKPDAELKEKNEKIDRCSRRRSVLPFRFRRSTYRCAGYSGDAGGARRCCNASNACSARCRTNHEKSQAGKKNEKDKDHGKRNGEVIQPAFHKKGRLDLPFFGLHCCP